MDTTLVLTSRKSLDMELHQFSAQDPWQASTSTSHHRSHEPKRLSHFYSRFGLISLLVVVSPLTVFALFVCVRNWGFWRLRTSNGAVPLGAVPYRRKQYIRTWHGWVEKAKIDESDVKIRRKTKLLNWIYPKLSLADLNKIFWDADLPQVIPEGPRHKEPWRRRLLWQIGWYQFLEEDPERAHMAMARHKQSSGPAVLSGLPILNTQARSSGIWMRGARNDFEMNAARRRKVSIPAIKLANSNAELRISPPKTRERVPSLDENLALTTAKLKHMSKNRRRNTNPERPSILQTTQLQVDSINLPGMGRSKSVPFLNASKRPFVNSLEEPGGPGHEIQYQLHEPRPPGAPSAPKNSEDTLTASNLRMLCRNLPTRSGGPEARTPEYIDGPISSGYEQDFAENLARRLEIWASPMLINPFTSGDNDLSGIAARRSSPAMGWRIVEDAKPPSSKDILGKGIANIHKQWWKRNLPQSVLDDGDDDGLRAQETQAGNSMRRPQGADLDERKLHSMHFPSKCSFTHLKSFPNWHSIPSSLLRPKIRPDRTLFTSLPRLFPRNPSSFTPILSYEGRPNQHLKSTEESFLEQLDRKLKWLAYELSAGFRGPEDNPAEGFQKKRYSAFAGTNANAVSRVTERRKLQLTNSYGSFSSINFVLPVRRRIFMPNVDSWRVSVNKYREMMSGDQILTARPQYGSETEEPREGDIDTAAWVLRRPPQGFPTPTAQKQAPLVGRWGRVAIEAEPPVLDHHYDWERIRRPSTVKRVAKRRFSTVAQRKIAHTKARAKETKEAIIHTTERAMETTEALIHSVREHHITKPRPGGHRARFLRRRRGARKSAVVHDSRPGFLAASGHEFPTRIANISALADRAPPEASDGRRVVSKGRNPFASFIQGLNGPRPQSHSRAGSRRPSIQSNFESI